MATVLLLGATPPPLVDGGRVDASHCRTWQFLQSLLSDGHDVSLCVCHDGSTRLAPPERATRAFPSLKACTVVQIGARGWRSQLRLAHETVEPDCVVAVNYLPCLAATTLATDRPTWMDLYGDQLTIQQAFCHRMQSDRGMPTTVRFMTEILAAGDVFSACGTAQRHMLVGELAMTERLNHLSFAYEFTRVVLPGSPPTSGTECAARDVVRARLGLGPEDFAVLWCGGYNTWTDVDTLFHGIEHAMALEPRIHYVSVGASTFSADRRNLYERLQELITRSAHRSRWHLLGWQPWTEVPSYCQACDVGLNIDAAHYETTYGTRTRLVEMIAAGLPVVTTDGTELGGLLRQLGAALTFPAGDATGLQQCLLDACRNRDQRARMGEAALAAACGPLSFERTTCQVREWVRDPRVAPDRIRRGRPPIAIRHRVRGLARVAAWRITGVPH